MNLATYKESNTTNASNGGPQGGPGEFALNHLEGGGIIDDLYTMESSKYDT